MIAVRQSAPNCCIVVSLLLLAGCMDPTAKVDGYKCSDFVQAGIYYSRSTEERMNEVRSYPLAKQYAVFICGVQHVRPPQWDVAQPFAENGAAAAEFLVQKLPVIDDDITIGNILTLVGDMDASGLYDVAPGTELWRALELAVSRMEDRDQKRAAADQLDRLAKNK